MEVPLIALVVPVFRPEDSFLDLVRSLANLACGPVVVIDDGNGKYLADVFSGLGETVEVLHHEFNRGKGQPE